MKYLIFLLFAVALVHAQTANCNIREGMSLEKVYITQNETQAFSFRDYFTGFNLYYHAKAAEKTYKIVQSIYETSRLEIPAPPESKPELTKTTPSWTLTSTATATAPGGAGPPVSASPAATTGCDTVA